MSILPKNFSITFTLVLAAVSLNCFASNCWITENYQGYSSRLRTNFIFEKDSMTSTKYVIEIDGKNSRVIGSNIDTYIQTSENSIIAIDITENGSVIETWSIFPSEKKSLYTKTINGYGQFDGTISFVGSLTGSCKSEKEI